MRDIISVANMRKSDEYATKNYISGIELMQRAAQGVFKKVSWYGKVAVVCGGGNNAGDGYALALILSENNVDCDIILMREKFSSDGLYYFKKCVEKSIPCYIYDNNDFSDYDIIVDCIFGIGFKGNAAGVEKDVINAVNKSGKYVVSVDMNSGLDGENGMTELCIKSNLTVSIGAFKPGHFLNMAKDNIKEAVNCDIGIKPIYKPYALIEASDIKELLGNRANFSNKGTYGYITLIGGSYEYSGAAKLANLSLASLKTGAGVARLAVPRCICNGVMPYLLESTLFPLSDRDGAIVFIEDEIKAVLKNSRVVAVGMGMGQKGDNEKLLEFILKNYDIPVIIDADGINTLAKMDMSLVKNTNCRVILTPHLKEFECLTGIPKREISEHPVDLALTYAKDNNVILLLKGPTTIITDGENVVFSDTGCAGMATAGSGDVLCGILAGVCSANSVKGNELLYVSAGAYINGRAGETAQQKSNAISMTSSDTVACIAETVSGILNS